MHTCRVTVTNKRSEKRSTHNFFNCEGDCDNGIQYNTIKFELSNEHLAELIALQTDARAISSLKQTCLVAYETWPARAQLVVPSPFLTPHTLSAREAYIAHVIGIYTPLRPTLQRGDERWVYTSKDHLSCLHSLTPLSTNQRLVQP